MKKEMEFYKGMVQGCKDVFKRHPKPEDASINKKERSSEGLALAAGAEVKRVGNVG